MDAAEKMKYKLADSMKELMEHYPVEKITVKQIVDDCGVTRQTFYRHFKDKYDLVNWHFDKLVQKSFQEMGGSLSLQEGLAKKFEFIKGEGKFFPAAFSCESQNCLKEYDYEWFYQFYRKMVLETGMEEIPEDIEFLLKMYCRGSIHMTAEWATTGMKVPPKEMAERLMEALPPKLLNLLGRM